MSNTTKENVLLIASQLETFVRNTRQLVLLTVDIAADSREYTVNVDNVPSTVTSGVGATLETIRDLLLAKLISDYSTIEFAASSTDKITASPKDSNTYVNIDSDTDLYITTTVEQIARRGELLFDLVLDDVAIVCTEEWFRTEQERAQRYLAAHILTVLKDAGFNPANARSAGDIIKERVDEVELWYSDGAANNVVSLGDSDLLSTPFGKVFLEIRSRHSVVFM